MTRIRLGDSILRQRTVAGTVAGALSDHVLRETPVTFAAVETAVWHVLPVAERGAAHAVADDLCRQARSVAYRAPSGEASEALDRALGV
jgi:hypothetical protein